MLSGYPPFYGKTENEKVEKILSAKYDFGHSVWNDVRLMNGLRRGIVGVFARHRRVSPQVSDQAKDFITKCLCLQPKQRWSVKQLKEHPW